MYKKNIKTLKSHKGPFYIYAEYYFYSSTIGAPEDGLLIDPSTNEPIKEDSIEELLKTFNYYYHCNNDYRTEETDKRIYLTTDQTYVLRHGEYSRPTYMIIGKDK